VTGNDKRTSLPIYEIDYGRKRVCDTAVGLLNIQVQLKLIISISIMNLVTPKARAERKLLFNKPASGIRIENRVDDSSFEMGEGDKAKN
jgi:hypothetical protein